MGEAYRSHVESRTALYRPGAFCEVRWLGVFRGEAGLSTGLKRRRANCNAPSLSSLQVLGKPEEGFGGAWCALGPTCRGARRGGAL